MAWVQRVDPPGNVFPSLHVAQTTMLSLILLMRDRPRLGRVALVMATMLALSTLTTKQHFIADVSRLRARLPRRAPSRCAACAPAARVDHGPAAGCAGAAAPPPARRS